MRNLGLAKKALLLALCAALAVPAAGMGWTPLTAEAEDPVKTPEELLQEAKDSAIVQKMRRITRAALETKERQKTVLRFQTHRK